MNRYVWLVSLFLLATACGTGKTSKGQTGKGKAAELTAFPYPEVPAVMTVPEDRMAYLLEHFWERYDFRDTALLGRREITEQGFADFVGLLMQSGDKTLWQRAMRPFAEAVAKTPEAYRCFGELAELYLYDANSPMRDEAEAAGRRGVCPLGIPAGVGDEEPRGAGGNGLRLYPGGRHERQVVGDGEEEAVASGVP